MEIRWPSCQRSMDRLTRAGLPADRASPIRGVIVAVILAAVAAGCVASPGVGSRGQDKEKRTPEPTASSTSSLDALPPGLVGKSWFSEATNGGWLAGRFGKPGVIDLPPAEHPLAGAGGRIVTATWETDLSTTLRVRDLATGTVAELGRPESIVTGVLVGDELVAGPADRPGTGGDPGLVAISLPGGTARQLIAPGPAPNGWTGDLTRTVSRSPSGKSVASGLCGSGRCAADVVDVASGVTRRVVEDAVDLYPGPSTDDVLIAGSGDSARLVAFDVASGNELWARSDAEFDAYYLTADGRLILAYQDFTGPGVFRVSVIDPRSNAERVLLERDPNEGLALWPELSTDGVAAVATGGPFGVAAIHSPVVLVHFLDLTTGELGRRTFPFKFAG